MLLCAQVNVVTGASSVFHLFWGQILLELFSVCFWVVLRNWKDCSVVCFRYDPQELERLWHSVVTV